MRWNPRAGIVALLLAAVIGCGPGDPAGEPPPRERGGPTVEAPPPVEDDEATPHTTERGNCRISTFFLFDRGNVRQRFEDLAPGLVAGRDQVLLGRIVVVPAKTRGYPGTLTFGWTRNGAAVPLTDTNGNAFTTRQGETTTITVTASREDKLEAELRRLERELSTAGAGYYFRVPPGVNATTAVLETVAGWAEWKPENEEACRTEDDLTVQWIFANGATGPRPADRNGNHLRGSPFTQPYTDPGGGRFVVLPIFHYWDVGNPNDCCGRPGPYQVIQFARVVYFDHGNGLRKGQSWTLDIRKAEKDRANSGQPYDPTFTNDPRGTNPGGSMVKPAPRGNPAIRQDDAPGMTRQRFNELTNAQFRVEVVFQLMAFLVCPPAPPGVNPAATYLREAKVVRVALYELEWRFPGTASGVPNVPKIDARIKAVKDGRCRTNLEALLQANGLIDAYRRPGPAELSDFPPAEHSGLQNSVRNAGIRSP